MVKASASTIEYGRYIIRAMKIGSQWKSRAFLAGARPGYGHIEEAVGMTEAEAIAGVRSQLDTRDRVRAMSVASMK